MALEHIFLHVGLCTAIARADPDATIALHVQMAYQRGGDEIDKVVTFRRGYDSQTVVEFDVPRNTYLLELDVPKYHCSTSAFIDVLADLNRTITEALDDGPPAPPLPVVIMDGAAPMSFLYVKPTFAIFGKGLACNQPITTPLTSHVNVEYDQSAYYVWLYLDPTLDTADQLVVALKLRTPTGLAHYVHVPIPFPVPWGGWPFTVHFPVSEDMIDVLATEKTDTLLCPKLWESTSH
jgi:hypothetical protein